MKFSTYLAALAALALTACSSENDDIFDQSAADRLEQYKKDYTEVLTADGGLWTMEYFSNPDEPGYLFVMKFDKNGSVEISANHKWIGGEFKQETSLWRMIADNGPVLSFNSYNNLFHIFSDPANITGADAPKGEEGDDINETGYGHEGDYEFQVMEVSDDQNTVRLLGKKRLYDIYLRRIDANTDVNTYMDDYKQLSSNLFCKEISKVFFTDETGEKYIVQNAHTGVLSIYPAGGDAVEQTRTANFIVTPNGIRFMEPFEYVNASGQERYISEMKFSGNYSLVDVDNDGCILNAGTFAETSALNKCNWKVDMKSFDGSLKTAMDEWIEELRTLYNYKSANVNEMYFDYDSSKGSYVVRFYIRISAKGYETNRFIVDFSNADNGVRISCGEAYDNDSQLAYNAYPKLKEFLNLLTSSVAQYSSKSDCGPKSVILTVNGGSMTINAL
ncbi:MAG: DUF4302 domain-containing protein [Muribaculaceae bacterium]|nr:DUF4302 domain-containing protein [Muribaculaceae bacterium]